MKDIDNARGRLAEMESLTTEIANNGALLNTARELVKRQMDEYMRLRQVYIDSRCATDALQAESIGVDAVLALEAKRLGKTN